jgi:hypothetical protein
LHSLYTGGVAPERADEVGGERRGVGGAMRVARSTRRRHQLRQPHVRELGVTVRVNQNVGGLDVAVDHRLGVVRVSEWVGGAACDSWWYTRAVPCLGAGCTSTPADQGIFWKGCLVLRGVDVAVLGVNRDISMDCKVRRIVSEQESCVGPTRPRFCPTYK